MVDWCIQICCNIKKNTKKKMSIEQFSILLVLSLSNIAEILILSAVASELSATLKIFLGIQIILCLKNISLRYEAITQSYNTLLKRDGTDDGFVFISAIVLTMFIQQQKYPQDLGVFIPFYVMNILFYIVGLYVHHVLQTISISKIPSSAHHNTV